MKERVAIVSVNQFKADGLSRWHHDAKKRKRLFNQSTGSIDAFLPAFLLFPLFFFLLLLSAPFLLPFRRLLVLTAAALFFSPTALSAVAVATSIIRSVILSGMQFLV